MRSPQMNGWLSYPVDELWPEQLLHAQQHIQSIIIFNKVSFIFTKTRESIHGLKPRIISTLDFFLFFANTALWDDIHFPLASRVFLLLWKQTPKFKKKLKKSCASQLRLFYLVGGTDLITKRSSFLHLKRSCWYYLRFSVYTNIYWLCNVVDKKYPSF